MSHILPVADPRRVRDLERFVRHIVDACDTIEALAQHSGDNWREVFQLYAKELRVYAVRHLPAEAVPETDDAAKASPNGAGMRDGA